MALTERICLVTGASRGIGKGIAVQLGSAGATVYITGRAADKDGKIPSAALADVASEVTSRGGKGIPVPCDHSDESQVKSLFDKIKADYGRLDVLVNNAYAAVNFITEESGARRRFWEAKQSPAEVWDLVNNVGLRNHYVCSTYAAEMMVPRESGIIVNISSSGGLTYLFNVPYGVGKAALDRMAADMGHELKKHKVTCISLWPGAVLTEAIEEMLSKPDCPDAMKRIFSQGETPEFAGLAVAALASDPDVIKKTGRICFAADLGTEYGFMDVNGKQPLSGRSIKYVLRAYGYSWLAACCPAFIKLPGFVMTASVSKL